jgi:hypothetical protein
MWTKEKPTKEGYYWVCSKGQLSDKEYTHPVHVYSSKKNGIIDIVFSDGENFNIKSDMFIQWFSEQILMPAKVVEEPRMAIRKGKI